MAVNATEVLYLTSGLFKAAPSKAILTDLVKFNGTIDGLAASLGTSPFAVNAFPFSNAEKAKVLAENLLGSTVADKAAAVTALEGILNANGGNVGIAAAAGIRAILSDAAFADAKAQLENRVKVAAAYVDSNKGNEISTSILDSVTKDAATVTAAIASLSGTTGGNEAGADRVLTIAQDILTGTAGNDNFRAVAGVQQGQQDQTTLNSSDIIDGAAGADAIIVNMTGNLYQGGARLKNIETLQIGTNLTNGAVTFDYNVNQGQNEITEVTKVVYDQINQGENQRVVNLLKTGDALPTLAWTNEANSIAGTVQADFRQSAIEGTSTALTVELNNVLANVNVAATGVLNIGAGVETLNIVSAGTSGRNTLNNSGRNDGGAVDIVSAGSSTTVTEAGNDDGSLTKVVITGSQEFGKAAQVITASTDANYGLTDRNVANDTGISNSAGTLRATSANLASVAATVTEVDATGADGGVNIRFTAKQSGADTNVTFKGGKGNDYVELERGNVNADGGEGNDTFAFVVPVGTVAVSGFTSADSIKGGAGSDTILIGLNGQGNYTLNTTEFNNKTGIDTLDLRGNTNTVTLLDAFVAAADTTLTVRTDRIVQTSDTNSANPTDNTANNVVEARTVSTITLTQLAEGRAINVIGGAGSERLVGNNASINANTTIDAGTGLDTLTVLNTSVLDANDLANIKGLEALNLVETVTGASTFNATITEAFLANNGNSAGGLKTFAVVSESAAGGTQLNAATDIVNLDVTDLFNADGTVKASVTAAGYRLNLTDLIASGATVNLVRGGNNVAVYANGALTSGALPSFGDATTATNTAISGTVAGTANTGILNVLPNVGTGGNTGGGGVAPVAGNTFTLNANTVILNSVNSNLGTTAATGTFLSAGADTIVGGSFINGTSNWNITDTDATAGVNDVMSWTTTNAADAPVISGIETLNIQSFGGGANLNTISGNTTINVTGAGATFTNAQADEVFAVTNGFTGTLDITTATDGQAVKVTTTGATLTLDGNNAAGANVGISNFKITNSGTSTIAVTGDASGAGNTDVTLDGSGAVTLTPNAVVNTITATNYTGTLTVTTAVQSTVTGGSGNDTITGGAFAADSIFGGAGNDTISVAAGTGASTVRGGAGNDVITLNNAGGLQQVTFESSAANNGVDTISGVDVTGTFAGNNVTTFEFGAFVTTPDVIEVGGTTTAVGTATIASGDMYNTGSTGNIAANNMIVAFNNAGTALTAATLAAEFAGGGTAFSAVAGQRLVVIEGNSGTAANVNFWYVNDISGDGAITADEVSIVGTIANLDVSTLRGDMFV